MIIDYKVISHHSVNSLDAAIELLEAEVQYLIDVEKYEPIGSVNIACGSNGLFYAAQPIIKRGLPSPLASKIMGGEQLCQSETISELV